MADFIPMETPFTGGCVCGAVRYVCSSVPRLMLNCHCRDCQQTGGGGYAPILIVSFNSFRILSGDLRRHATTRVSGRPNLRGSCGTCGSRLTVGEDPERDVIGILAGSLDKPGAFAPALNIFTSDAQPWDLMDAALPQYPHYALPR